MKNRLIVFEGIDGVGKTTLSHLLVEALRTRNIKAICYEDVEDKGKGFNVIKPFIKKEVSIEASLFFYIASAIHKSTIIASLLEEQWVVSDRYVYSTLCYHKVRGARLSLLPPLESLPIIQPDFFFLILTEESVRKQRVTIRMNSKDEDNVPNVHGTLVNEMEKALLSFNPIIIDNSMDDPKNAIAQIMQILEVHIV